MVCVLTINIDGSPIVRRSASPQFPPKIVPFPEGPIQIIPVGRGNGFNAGFPGLVGRSGLSGLPGVGPLGGLLAGPIGDLIEEGDQEVSDLLSIFD